MTDLADVYRIYKGSDGDATKALYEELRQHGMIGALAVELFRAQKASERAKVYRGGIRGQGSYRGMAYDRKQWAIDNLCKALSESCSLYDWGWGIDDKQEHHRHALYVDLPTGQVSFHNGYRGEGPDYGKPWDGMPGQSPDRICRWIARILSQRETTVHDSAPAPSPAPGQGAAEAQRVSAITQFDGLMCGAFEGQGCGTAMPPWPDFPIPFPEAVGRPGRGSGFGAWARVLS